MSKVTVRTVSSRGFPQQLCLVLTCASLLLTVLRVRTYKQNGGCLLIALLSREINRRLFVTSIGTYQLFVI